MTSKAFNNFITAIIFILIIVIAIIAFVLARISLPTVIDLFKHDICSVEFNLLLASDRLKFLPYFVVSVAAFIALLTYLREKAKLRNEIEEKRSKIFLELAKEGLEGAYNMLKDQNNNRITWVRASRDILHALNLAKEIKTSQYLEAYRLFEEKIRHKLYLALTMLDEKTGARQPLPPQFFYGVADWKGAKNLDEVAKETSAQIKVGSVSIDQNIISLNIPKIMMIHLKKSKCGMKVGNIVVGCHKGQKGLSLIKPVTMHSVESCTP